jgi:hypothetical protein
MTCGFLCPLEKFLDFYWWRRLKVSPAAVAACTLLRYTSFWYKSIDLDTDPGLKSHLITFPSSE